ncbi:hypothetical protein ACFPVX_06265 [Cohnella faecalis]|uniref:Uncharacterized protein n=1 Tax=Cohnella faecalis TaxID=2315694 RepID=A0A398CSX6_9BACL|nr:hypothetical protein [Cohnella faecalis]RIE02064.1 hypothetical protein D3H35_14975 [Cohnella faecalis]
MDTRFETFERTVEQIVYSFYRYEINNGMRQLELFITQISELLIEYRVEGTRLDEINQLLQLILVSVENKDFLIVADLLKYELLGRVLLVSGSVGLGE